MDKKRSYKNGSDFRTALEARLNAISKAERISLERLRKKTAFDRFLARIFSKNEAPAGMLILKGGYSLGVRFERKARYTGDVDLSLQKTGKPTSESVHAMLFSFSERDLQDFFEFRVGTSTAVLGNAVYAGWRYPVEAGCGGRTFTKFSVDVAVGDALVSRPDIIKGSNLLEFAGIDAVSFPVYPKEQQFAEKLHSYTFPRELRVPSRIEDLLDLSLLIESGMPEARFVLEAVRATFEQRNTHPLPEVLPESPPSWEAGYVEMAETCGVKAKTPFAALKTLREYWETVA